MIFINLCNLLPIETWSLLCITKAHTSLEWGREEEEEEESGEEEEEEGKEKQ